LQLVVSLAPRQDLRLHRGRIYLTVGCNVRCAVVARGHLNVTSRHRHIGLRAVRRTLGGGRAQRLALALSRTRLALVRRLLRAHRRVVATVTLAAESEAGQRQAYRARVTLTYR
jgi:hypothetical protein